MRKNVLYFVVAFFSLILLVRLFFLAATGKESSLVNGGNHIYIKTLKKQASRGRIFDRNHEILVGNAYNYALIFNPSKSTSIDTLAFCKLVGISKNDFRKKLSKRKYDKRSFVFIGNISKKKIAYIQEKIHRFKAFESKKNTIRYYFKEHAAHILGYVSEVTDYIKKKYKNYALGDMIGMTGIERYYEKVLKGKKGIHHKHVNNFGVIVDVYEKGAYDVKTENGKDLELTIDIALQEYLEKLMKNKRGSVVAIEPQTGEILSLVTSPSYEPSKMVVGKYRKKYFPKLIKDTLNKPLFNRALLSEYAPGSVFKTLQALIGLQEGVISKKTTFKCYGGYQYGRRKNNFMKCHCGIYGEKITLKSAIFKSCNSYFCNVYKNIIGKYVSEKEGLNAWSKHIKSFGFGNFLGYDLPEGRKGLVPDSNFYNKWYRNRWRWTYTISNAIGQGQLLATPMQLANLAAIIANRGYYYIPHILKKIDGEEKINPKYLIRKKTSIASEHFQHIIEAMGAVFEYGTARYSALKNIKICGKTGTVQNFSRIGRTKIQHKDHSVFIAFAPKKDPKIALAIYVENGGFGSEIAAPIASLAIEKYLTGKTNQYRENEILNKDLSNTYQELINLKINARSPKNIYP